MIVRIAIILAAVSLIACTQPHRPLVFYVNSYHDGYAPSDEAMSAFASRVSADSFDVKYFFLDAKRSDSVAVQKNASDVVAKLKTQQPSYLIVSDDPALKYVVEHHRSEITMPVIYCGINWSSKSYRIDREKTVGMLEVLPLPQLLARLKAFNPNGRKLCVISENSLSESRNQLLLDTLFKRNGYTPQYFLVDTYAQWKTAFQECSGVADVIYLPTNGAIQGWDAADAQAFVAGEIRIPVVTCDAFMLPYCVMGMTKVPAEQGEYVARVLSRLANGAKPASFPETSNRKMNTLFNRQNAERIGFPVER